MKKYLLLILLIGFAYGEKFDLRIVENDSNKVITLEKNTEILYKCSDFYSPEHEAGIKFDDSDLSIDWGISTSEVTLSEKDQDLPSFKHLISPFIYEHTL